MVCEDGRQVSRWLDEVTNSAFSRLSEYFPESPGVFAVGGAVRDYLLGGARKPSDLDVAVAGIKTPDLGRIPGLRYNYFGGGAADVNGVGVDVWPLEESAVLKGTGLPRTIEGLLRAFDFNLERVAVDAKSGRLVDCGCIDGITEKTIDYDPINPRGPIIQAARLVLLKRKTGFGYSQRSVQLLQQAKTWAQDDSTWAEAVEYFKTGGKYLGQVDSLRQEILGFEAGEPSALQRWDSQGASPPK